MRGRRKIPASEGAVRGRRQQYEAQGARATAREAASRPQSQGVVVRQRRPPAWMRGEKAVLVLSLAFIFAAIILGVVLPML